MVKNLFLGYFEIRGHPLMGGVTKKNLPLCFDYRQGLDQVEDNEGQEKSRECSNGRCINPMG